MLLEDCIKSRMKGWEGRNVCTNASVTKAAMKQQQILKELGATSWLILTWCHGRWRHWFWSNGMWLRRVFTFCRCCEANVVWQYVFFLVIITESALKCIYYWTTHAIELCFRQTSFCLDLKQDDPGVISQGFMQCMFWWEICVEVQNAVAEKLWWSKGRVSISRVTCIPKKKNVK